MNYQKFIITSAFIVCNMLAWSQSANPNFVYLIHPLDATVKLDGKLVHAMDTLELSDGIHTIQAWAPKLEFYDYQFEITSDSIVEIRKGLQYSSIYMDYRKENSQYLNNYWKLKKGGWVLTFGGTIIFASSAIINNRLAVKNERIAYDSWVAYQTTLSDLFADHHKNVFEKRSKKSRIFRASSNISGGLACAVLAAGIYQSIKWSKKADSLPKPEFIETNPLANLEISPVLLQNNFNQSLGLCLRIKF